MQISVVSHCLDIRAGVFRIVFPSICKFTNNERHFHQVLANAQVPNRANLWPKENRSVRVTPSARYAVNAVGK